MDHNDKRGSVDAQTRSNGIALLALPLLLGLVGAALLCFGLGHGEAVSALSTALPLARAVHTPNEDPGIEFVKTVQPDTPDTGGVISVCINVSGHSRQDLDLILAQDVSPSMGEWAFGKTRLAACKEAANTIIDTLPTQDRIGVVTYDRIADLVHELTTDREAIRDTVDGIVLGNYGTNIGEAIFMSHQVLLFSPEALPHTLKTIIVLSDGFATCDENRVCGGSQAILNRAADYARAQAALAAENGIRIYTIGFGDQMDRELLSEIAALGGGTYYEAPDQETLETIYETIVNQLRSLTITDVLIPGLKTDCAWLPETECTVGAGGVTTVTWSVANPTQLPDPVGFCLTATVQLDPGYVGPSNLPGSQVCYTCQNGKSECEDLPPPIIRVGGRKITGHVFNDLDRDGVQGPGEVSLPDITLRASTGWVTQTDVLGTFMTRTSNAPPLELKVDVPEGYAATTPNPRQVPAVSGIYTINFGIREFSKYYLPHLVVEYHPLPYVINGGFEDGWTGWSHGGELRQSVVSTNRSEGSFSALLGDPGYECEGGVPIGSAWVEQTIYVPRRGPHRLAFRFHIVTQDTNPNEVDKEKYDSFDVKINNKLVFDAMRRSEEYGCEKPPYVVIWQEKVLDISSEYHGRQVNIRFEVRNSPDGWYNTWAYVDAVRLIE